MFYPGPGDTSFTWPALLPLRKHIQTQHPVDAMAHLGNSFLHRLFRIAFCTKPGCGAFALIAANTNKVPHNPESDGSWDALIANKHDCAGFANPARRRVPRIPSPPLLDLPQGAPNGAVAPWLAEAMMLVSTYESLEDLPPCPNIIAKLPTRSKVCADSVSTIFGGVAQGLKVPNLSQRDAANIWKVVAFLPRFVALAPCKSEQGEEVAVVRGFINRCLQVIKPGGPTTLWKDHIAAARARGPRFSSQHDSDVVSDSERNQRKCYRRS